MILETLVTTVLNRVIGQYVELGPSQLNLSFWTGHVTLENLQLKPNVLEELTQLQMIFKEAKITKLDISIPWMHLRSQPIVLTIKGVHVTVAPKEKFEWSRDREIQIKRNAIHKAEESNGNQSNEEKKVDVRKPVGYFDSLITSIADNVQIELEDIRLTFENKSTKVPDFPIVSFGVRLDSASLYSTNDTFSDPQFNDSHLLLHKALRLKGLGICWRELAEENEVNQETSAVKEQPKEGNDEDHWILKPLDARANVLMRTKARSVLEMDDIPLVRADISTERIHFELTQQKYQEILNVVNGVLRVEKKKQYSAFRPKKSVRENPKGWWRFAFRCIKNTQAKKGPSGSPMYILSHTRDTGKYVKMYKRLRYAGLTVDGKLPENFNPRDAGVSVVEWEDIELRLPVEDIVKCRASAHRELREEGFYNSQLQIEQNPSWFDFLPSEVALNDLNVDDLEEEKAKPAAPKKEKKHPRDEIQIEMNVNIGKGIVVLKDVVPSTAKDSSNKEVADKKEKKDGKGKQIGDIVDLRVKGIVIGMRMYDEAMDVMARVIGFRLVDNYTPNTCFPRLIETIDNGDDDRYSLDVFFQSKPLDKPGVDYFLKAKATALQFIYNRFWVEKTISFFSKSVVPDAIAASIKQIEEAALDQITRLLETSQVIKVDADIDAPKILLPANVSDKDTTSIFLDLGRIVAKSSEIKGQTVEEFKRQKKNSKIDEDVPQTVGVITAQKDPNQLIKKEEDGGKIQLFNSYLVSLTRLNLGTTKAHTLLSEKDYKRNVHKHRYSEKDVASVEELMRRKDPLAPLSRDHLVIVEDFDIGIVVDLCAIIDEDIPYLRVGGNVPQLALTLSSRTVQDIIVIFTQALIPDLDTAFEADLSPEEKAEQDKVMKALVQRKKEKAKAERENKKVHIRKEQLNKGILFEGAFSINLLNVTLLRDIETKLGTIISTLPTEELAIASLRDFGVKIKVLPTEMMIGIELSAFVVEDKITMDGAEYSKLISSDPIFSEDRPKDGKIAANEVRMNSGRNRTPLITINIEMLDHASPLYDGEEMLICVTLNELYCTFNRESIVEIAQFGLDCVPSEIRKVTPTLKDLQLKTGVPDEEKSDEEKREEEQVTGIHITVTLSSVVVFFNKAGSVFAEMGLHRASVGIKTRTKSMDIVGSVGRVSMSDLSPKAPYPDIMWIVGDEETIRFSFKSYDKTGVLYPGYDSDLGVQIGTVKVTYSHKFVNTMVSYMNRMLEMQKVLETTKIREGKPPEDKAPPSLMKIKALINSPKLLIPSDIQKDGSLVIDLGVIFVHNHFDYDKTNSVDVQKMVIDLEDLNMIGYARSDEEMVESAILHNISFKVTIDMLDKKGLPQMAINIDIPSIVMNVDDIQLKLFIDLYLQYIVASDYASIMGTEEQMHQPTQPPKPDGQVMMVLSVHLNSFKFKLSKTQGVMMGALSTRVIDKKAIQKARINFKDDSSVKLVLAVRGIDKMDRFGLSDPFLVVSRKAEGGNVPIHETEYHKKTLNASFEEFEIPVRGLLDDEVLLVECFDWNQVQSRQLIGSTEFTLGQLLSTKDFELYNPDKAKKRNYRNSGRLIVVSVKPINAETHTEDVGDKDNEDERNAESSTGTQKSDNPKPQPLGDLFVDQLKVGMVMNVDGAMFVNVSSPLLGMENTRSEHNRRVVALSNTAFKMDMNNEGLMKMYIKVPSIELIFNPQFLMPFYVFAMNGLNYMSRDLGARERAPRRTQEEIKILTNPNLSHMVVEVIIDEVRVRLMEKPNERSSKEVSIGMGIFVRYSLIGLINEVVAQIRGVEIPNQRVLFPHVSIDFNMIGHPDFSSLSIHTDPLTIVVTYKDYAIINGVLEGYNAATRDMSEKGEVLENYNTAVKPLSRESVPKSSQIGAVPWYMEIDIGGIRIALKSDFPELPNLLEFHISSMGLRGLYPTQIKTSFFVAARYYNLTRAFWEALIEPCEMRFHYKSNIRGDTWITLKTPPVMELNVTAAMGKTLAFWAQERQEDEYYPITIRNFTSKVMDWHLPLKTKNLGSSLQPGCVAPIEVPFTDVNDLAEFAVSKLDVSFGNNFSLKKLGILDQSMALFTTVKGSDNITDKIIYDITFKENRRVITVRSVVLIKNMSKYPIEVCAELSRDGTNNLNTMVRYVHPSTVLTGGDMSVPSEFLEAGNLFFRPEADQEGQFTWSNGLVCKTMQASRLDLAYTRKSGDKPYYFRCDIHGDQNSFNTRMYTIYITDPMTIDNLLPCELEYNLVGTEVSGVVESQTVKAINDSPATAYRSVRVRIPNSEWSDVIALELDEGHFTIPEGDREVEIFYERSPKRGVSTITLFAKHWIINRTEFVLHIYGSKTSKNLGNTDETSGTQNSKINLPLSQWKPEWYDLGRVNSSKPFIYSTPAKRFGGRVEKAHVTINDSERSEGMRFDVIDAGELQVFDQSRSRAFKLGVHVRLADGKMKRTKIVTITPRIVLINNMGRRIFIKQVGTEEIHCIENKRFAPFHFLTAGREQINISFDTGDEWSWSGGLEINTIGETYLKLTHQAENMEYFVRVDVMMQNNSIFVAQFNPKRLGIFPYRIENQTRQRVTVWQTENDQVTKVINPGDHLNYAWDEPSKPRFLQVQFDDVNKPYQISLDRVEYSQFESSIYAGEVTIESKTRILWLKDYRSHMAVIDRQARDKTEENEVKMMIKVKIPQIGISVVDPHPKELLFVSMEGMLLEYDTSTSKTTMNMSIGHFQVDNQLYQTPFPVLLVPKAGEAQEKFLEMSYRASNIYETVQFIDGFTVNVRKVELCVDALLLNSLLHLHQSVQTSNETHIEDQAIQIQRDDIKKPMYLRLFFISPIAADFSFTYPAYKAEKEDLLKLWVSPLIGSLPNIDKSPLVLKPIFLEHPVYEENQLMQVLQTHYINTLIRESYKLVGAVDLIANPFRFLGTVAEGVKDVLVVGPQKVIGKSESSQEHDKNEAQTKEQEIQRKKREHTREAAPPEYQHALETFERVPGFRETIGEGFWELGHGFATGVTGVVRDPIRGAKKDGPLGLVAGIGKGIFGIIKKPVHGIHDFGSKSMKAIAPQRRATDDQTHRRRLPRYFGNSRILEPYSLDMAYGQFLLVAISGAAYADEDCMHNLIVGDKIYLVTDFRVVCLNLDDFSVRWQIVHKNIVYIAKDYPRIILDEGKEGQVCPVHSCEFLVEECQCHIPPEAKTGRRFLIESTEREFPLLWAALFRSWSFWHRIATPPELQFDIQNKSGDNMVHQNFVKRELQFFGAMDVAHKIQLVENDAFSTHVAAGDKQETKINQSNTTNSIMIPSQETK